MRVSSKKLLLAAAGCTILSSVLATAIPKGVDESSVDLLPRIEVIDPDPISGPKEPGAGGGDGSGGTSGGGGGTSGGDPAPLSPPKDPANPDDGNAVCKRTGGSCSPGSAQDPFPKLESDTSGNGQKDGVDPTGRPYIKMDVIEIMTKIPPENRNPVFFTDQGQTEGVGRFTRERLGGKAFDYFQVFDKDWDKKYPTKSQDDHWLQVYRGSNAMARASKSPDIYVFLDTAQSRTIFSHIEEKKPGGAVEKPGVGQVFYQAELPAIMRNPNTQRIFAVNYDARTGTFQTTKQWDASTDLNKFPRNFAQEMPLDSVSKIDPVPNSK